MDWALMEVAGRRGRQKKILKSGWPKPYREKTKKGGEEMVKRKRQGMKEGSRVEARDGGSNDPALGCRLHTTCFERVANKLFSNTSTPIKVQNCRLDIRQSTLSYLQRYMGSKLTSTWQEHLLPSTVFYTSPFRYFPSTLCCSSCVGAVEFWLCPAANTDLAAPSEVVVEPPAILAASQTCRSCFWLLCSAWS